MLSDYPNLIECCGGSLTPETLTRFRLAMREHETFIDRLGRLLAPGGMTIDIITRGPDGSSEHTLSFQRTETATAAPGRSEQC